MESKIVEARRPQKPRVTVVFGENFPSEYKSLPSAYQNRIRQLIDHYSYGTRLLGKDKNSGGLYEAVGLRHFHIDLQKPDPLLFYQVKQGVLKLVRIANHGNAFNRNERDFFKVIEGDLLERRKSSVLAT